MQVTHTNPLTFNAEKTATETTAKKNTATSATPADTPERITDKLYARLEENDVNLSSRAQKLNAISQKFFSGVIKAEQIPMLKQQLFTEGFISEKDYAAMGGKPEKVKALNAAINFTRSYSETLKTTDTKAFKGMQMVLLALQNANQPFSSTNQKLNKSAIQFLQAHTLSLPQKGVDNKTQTALNQVLKQLQTLDKNNEKPFTNEAINHYANIQNSAK